MASQREKYRANNSVLDDKFFNDRFFDVDQRLHALEITLGQYDAAVDQLIARGLQQISTQLQASIAAVQDDLETAEATLETVEQALQALEEAVQSIVAGSLPAIGVTITAIEGLDAENAQEALAAHQLNIAGLGSELDALAAQVHGLGDIKVVADYAEAAALSTLSKHDVVHVIDNGAGKWVRYQITAAGDGTWGGATKIVYWTQDQAPASHGHVIGDVTGLQSALDLKVPTSRSVATDGLATGGGDLSADRTIGVGKASASEFRAKAEDAKALTPKQVFDAAAPVTLSQAATIAVDMATGLNFQTTMTGNRTLGNPTNVVAGTSGSLRIIQDGTGGRALDYAANWKFAGGTKPVLSTAANAVDILHWKAWASDFVEAVLVRDVK